MFEALEKARAESNTRIFEREDNPRCPHCGKTYDIDENESHELYEEGVHEIECGDCGQEFTVSVHALFFYSTNDADEYA